MIATMLDRLPAYPARAELEVRSGGRLGRVGLVVTGDSYEGGGVLPLVEDAPFARVDITLDGEPVADGDTVDLHDLALGAHTLAVEAEDTAGNVAKADVTFAVVATLDSLVGSVERLVAEGDIDAQLARSLLAKLDDAKASVDRGDTAAAANILTSFINEVKAQCGKKISAAAADLLMADAEVVRDELRG